MLLKILPVLLGLIPFCVTRGLETVVEWKTLDFGFAKKDDQQNAMKTGLLKSKRGNPVDVDVEYKANGDRRIFMTIPRLTDGIPYSLATVTPGSDIQPYPNFSEWHSSNGKNCDAISSAYRVTIDECNRMWVVDSGKIAKNQTCPPQLLIFDLNTDKLLLRYKINDTVYNAEGLLTTIVTYVKDPPPKGSCSKTLAFIADTGFHGLLVYDLEKNNTWRVSDKLMYPHPEFSAMKLGGEVFTLMNGITGLSVTPRNFKGQHFVYFNALTSETQNAIKLSIATNSSLWTSPRNLFPKRVKSIGVRGVPSTVQAMDSRGNVFSVTMDNVKLFSWNIETPYELRSFKILADDTEQLQFASGIKVVRNSVGQEELWILTNRYQKVLTGSRDFNEINFRILACNIDDLYSLEASCRVLNDWNDEAVY